MTRRNTRRRRRDLRFKRGLKTALGVLAVVALMLITSSGFFTGHRGAAHGDGPAEPSAPPVSSSAPGGGDGAEVGAPPEESAPPGENALRQRRLHFYERAGFAPLGYQAVLFGVRYAMLSWPAAGPQEAERLQAAHRALYQSEVPPLLFRRVIHIPTEKPTPARKD